MAFQVPSEVITAVDLMGARDLCFHSHCFPAFSLSAWLCSGPWLLRSKKPHQKKSSSYPWAFMEETKGWVMYLTDQVFQSIATGCKERRHIKDCGEEEEAETLGLPQGKNEAAMYQGCVWGMGRHNQRQKCGRRIRTSKKDGPRIMLNSTPFHMP